ncbi:uncharacterized protein SRS1_14598 [Sporisorium reilianum f. sp. reilianum]|uniref:Dynamin-type G domain-containing protein n=1 Tax=Sporisorium reilianum f. sp. reilianum TaxID=72559 RepID=A0A2N8UG08_9BASI|nr:uncharacterized protein SRS1_14598 [Sporisorium reilianum f. sp. reilianum]
MDRLGQAQGAHASNTTMQASDYGAIVRRLTSLCQQIEALSVPIPPPDAMTTPAHLQVSSQRTASGIKLSFPRLVLVGGQSAGKSSLVESLAGISLPRSHGTCTRGPLDIVVTSATNDDAASADIDATSWSAVVSLVLPASRAGAGGGIVQFGDAIDHPSLVADRIRRASLAVLDLDHLPSLQPGSSVINDSPYLSMSSDELVDIEDDAERKLPTFFPAGTRLFLSIRAPGAEPLRFTDLPGLIASGRTSDINATRNMIKREIKDDNVIIVFAASLANDLQNQGGFALAREVDPKGKRTVGVLTMPDRMVPSSGRQWARMINDSSPNSVQDGQAASASYYHLKHGWHVVRGAASNEDRDSIRDIEHRFFHGDVNVASSEWHLTASMLDSVGDDGNQDFVETRCGLDNLHHRLSQLLLQQIRSTLPGIVVSAAKLLEHVNIEHQAAVAAIKNDLGHKDGEAGVPAGADDIAQSFPTRRELFMRVDEIVKHFHILSHNINTELAPRLNYELLAIAPIYLPFTAAEARDLALTAAYRPRPWTFCSKLSNKAVGGASLDLQQQGGDDETVSFAVASTSGARAMLPKKKAITVDELIEELKRGPSFSHAVATTHIYEQAHSQLQAKFRSAVLNYAEVARKHLALLIKNAIPATLQSTYPQLVADLLAIANEFVQGRLSNEMHVLAEGAAQHSIYEYGTIGGGAGSGLFDAMETDEAGDNEYKAWVADEQQTYLMLRMSLIAKEKADAGDRHFITNANKMIDFQYKAGLVSKHDFERLGYNTSGSGRPRASTAEPDEGSTVEATSPATRSQVKGARKAPAKAPSPGPTTAVDGTASSPSTPTRKRTTTANTLDDPPTTDVHAAPGVYSTPKLTVHRHLVLIAETMMRKQRWLYTALELMANLRGDFNFFSLLVADKAQGIPVWLMKGLYSHLAHTVSRTFGNDLADDEVYARYFYEADRPRRERVERAVRIKERRERVLGVVAELKALEEVLDRVVAEAVQKRVHHRTPTTPQRTAASASTKSSPSTPRTPTNKPRPASTTPTKRSGASTPTRITPQKRALQQHAEPTTPTKMRTTSAAAPTRSMAHMMGLSGGVVLAPNPLAYATDSNQGEQRTGAGAAWLDPQLEAHVISSDSEAGA